MRCTQKPQPRRYSTRYTPIGIFSWELCGLPTSSSTVASRVTQQLLARTPHDSAGTADAADVRVRSTESGSTTVRRKEEHALANVARTARRWALLQRTITESPPPRCPTPLRPTGGDTDEAVVYFPCAFLVQLIRSIVYQCRGASY